MSVKRISWNGQGMFHTREHLMMEVLRRGDCNISSTVNGFIGETKLTVNYEMHITDDWQVKDVNINGHLDDDYMSWQCVFASDRWLGEDINIAIPVGYRDVDISISPFTNSLAINRLNLVVGAREEIEVLYFDVLARKITLVRQVYTRLDQYLYRYENGEGDFQAELIVDQDGFVLDYPNLFKGFR